MTEDPESWLRNLDWDGTHRIKGKGIKPWLTRYLNAKGDQEGVGALWFASAVARVLEPSGALYTVLILVGPPGCGKSSACRALNNGTQAGAEPWIIEVSDFSGATLEGSIQRHSEKCSFIVTTQHAPSHNETISRPFWLVQVGKVDLPALAEDCAQLWAEAVATRRSHR